MVNQLVLNTATIGLVISIIGFEIGVFYVTVINGQSSIRYL